MKKSNKINLKAIKLLKQAIEYAEKKDYDKAIALAKKADEYMDHYMRVSGPDWVSFFKSQKNIEKYGNFIVFKYFLTEEKESFTGDQYYELKYTLLRRFRTISLTEEFKKVSVTHFGSEKCLSVGNRCS